MGALAPPPQLKGKTRGHTSFYHPPNLYSNAVRYVWGLLITLSENVDPPSPMC